MDWLTKKEDLHLLRILAIFTILLGLTYVLGLYGTTEREVGIWGLVTSCVGVALVISHLFLNRFIGRIIITILLIYLVLSQTIPISMWFAFHGHGISDGTPRATFIAHWGYSIPHITVFIISIYNLFRLKNYTSNE